MLFKTRSAAALRDRSAHLIDVEVDFSGVKQEQETFSVVGLPDAAVRESRDRVRSAIKNSGFDLPPTRITINLAPADLKKEGSGFDLSIAVGILGAYGGLAIGDVSDFVLVGELGLDGTLRAVQGMLPVAIAAKNAAASATSSSLRRTHARQQLVQDVSVYPVQHTGSKFARGSFNSAAHAARSKPNRSASRRAPCSKRHWITSPTSATSAASMSPSARSKSPPPAATTSS